MNSNVNPIATDIDSILTLLDNIAGMAADQEQRHMVVAQEIRLNQILSRIELILSFVELQRPYKFRGRL